MDMGGKDSMGASPGSVEVGGQDDGSGDSSQGVTIAITLQGGQVTMEQYAAGGTPSGNGQTVDIADALKAVLDAYEGQESPDGDEANFQSGLGASGGGTGSAGSGPSSAAGM